MKIKKTYSFWKAVFGRHVLKVNECMAEEIFKRYSFLRVPFQQAMQQVSTLIRYSRIIRNLENMGAWGHTTLNCATSLRIQTVVILIIVAHIHCT